MMLDTNILETKPRGDRYASFLQRGPDLPILILAEIAYSRQRVCRSDGRIGVSVGTVSPPRCGRQARDGGPHAACDARRLPGGQVEELTGTGYSKIEAAPASVPSSSSRYAPTILCQRPTPDCRARLRSSMDSSTVTTGRSDRPHTTTLRSDPSSRCIVPSLAATGTLACHQSELPAWVAGLIVSSVARGPVPCLPSVPTEIGLSVGIRPTGPPGDDG